MRNPIPLPNLILWLLIISAQPLSLAQVPHVFNNGDTADADQINENFNHLQSEIDDLADKVPCVPASATGKWRAATVTDGEYEIVDLTFYADMSLSFVSSTAEYDFVSGTGTWEMSVYCRVRAVGSSSLGALFAYGYLSDDGNVMTGLVYNYASAKWGAANIVRFNR